MCCSICITSKLVNRPAVRSTLTRRESMVHELCRIATGVRQSKTVLEGRDTMQIVRKCANTHISILQDSLFSAETDNGGDTKRAGNIERVSHFVLRCIDAQLYIDIFGTISLDGAPTRSLCPERSHCAFRLPCLTASNTSSRSSDSATAASHQSFSVSAWPRSLCQLFGAHPCQLFATH